MLWSSTRNFFELKHFLKSYLYLATGSGNMIFSRQQKLLVVITGMVVGYLAWRRHCRMLRKIRWRRVINIAGSSIFPKQYISMKQWANKRKLYYTKAGPKTNCFSSFYETFTEASFQIMFRILFCGCIFTFTKLSALLC